MSYLIYVKGCYSQEKDEGACAYRIHRNDTVTEGSFRVAKRGKGGGPYSELAAAIAPLKQVLAGSEATIVSGCDYVTGVLSGAYNPSKNLDIIGRYRQIVWDAELKVTFRKPKTEEHNEMEICEELCNKCVGYDINAEYRQYRKTKLFAPTPEEEVNILVPSDTEIVIGTETCVSGCRRLHMGDVTFMREITSVSSPRSIDDIPVLDYKDYMVINVGTEMR